jgi:drug/metabolite transporter (DMT)-like permease
LKISKKAAYGMMAVAAIMWATSGTLTSLAIDQGADVLQVTVLSYLFSSAILLPALVILDPKSLRVERKDFLPLLAFSVVTGTFFSLAWFICIDLTGVPTAVTLLYAYPSIVTIASIFLLGEKLTIQKAMALPLTFVGAVLVATAGFKEGLSFNLLGIALGVYTAIAAAVYYLWGKKFLDRYSANTVILYMTVLSIPPLLAIALPFAPFSHPITAAAWLWIFLIALVPSTIGFVVSMFALRYIEASKASIVASIEPVAAVVIAFLVLSEAINEWQGIGVALVFIGVLLLRLRAPGPQDKPEEVVFDR